MSYSINAGQMKTKIRIEKRTLNVPIGSNPNGYDVENWQQVGGVRRCRYTESYGQEAFQSFQAGYTRHGKVVMRYEPEMDESCRVYLDDDPLPYSVYGVHAADQVKHWMEFRVQRKEEAI